MHYSSVHIASTVIIAIHLYFSLFLFKIGGGGEGGGTLWLRVVPGIKLSEKLYENQPNNERWHISIAKDIINPQNRTIYKSFKELCNCIKKVKFHLWVKEECEQCLKLSLLESPIKFQNLKFCSKIIWVTPVLYLVGLCLNHISYTVNFIDQLKMGQCQRCFVLS